MTPMTVKISILRGEGDLALWHMCDSWAHAGVTAQWLSKTMPYTIRLMTNKGELRSTWHNGKIVEPASEGIEWV